MGKGYEITEENARELRTAMKKEPLSRLYRRMEAVALRGEGKSNGEVAQITKFNEKYVSQLVSLYANEGLESLSKDKRKGGNHRNLTRQQEEKLLEGFRGIAESGQIITASEIKKKYDEAIGRETKPTFIYSVLSRHEWRKVMPRSQHPNKASDEEIESSKKLSIV